MIKLYKQKKDCCACTSCLNACPKQAIAMCLDEDGFIYPQIDHELCVGCVVCKTVCAFKNVPVNTDVPIASYAAINKNQSFPENHLTGGILARFASIIFEKEGRVGRCAFNSELESKYIWLKELADIKKMHGSKFVQGNTNTAYAETEKYLKQGKLVLFTGTPCQIAGLKFYLGEEYPNLITADIICHGVANVGILKGYIKYLEDKLQGQVIEFKLRGESKEGRLTGKVVYKKYGVVRDELIFLYDFYYYNHLLSRNIYRESCYDCKCSDKIKL